MDAVMLTVVFLLIQAPSCADEPRLVSPGGTAATAFGVVNATPDPIRVYWRDFDGGRRLEAALPPDGLLTEGSFEGHLFTVTDEALFCRAIVTAKNDATYLVTKAGVRVATPADRAAREERQMKAYTRTTVADLPVFVHARAKKDQAALEKAIALLGSQLTRFRDLLGPAHAAAFKDLSVWIEADVGDGVFSYHNHSGDEMRKRGELPGKGRAIIMPSVASYARIAQDQPMVLLHELTHSVYDNVFHGQHAAIDTAYENARTSRIYENVERGSSERGRAYGMKNPDEYFAELTEAYFGYNDWFPHTREDLAAHDPEGYRAMVAVWGDRGPLDALPAAGCAGNLRSTNGGVRSVVRFVNKTAAPIVVAWIDAEGARHEKLTLAPGKSGGQQTWAGHTFAATTSDGRCLGAYTAAERPAIAAVAGSGTP